MWVWDCEEPLVEEPLAEEPFASAVASEAERAREALAVDW